MKSIVIAGGSLAGLSTARGLRKLGYDGRLTVLSAETHAPYDRPPLSKGFLAGTVTEAELSLRSEDDSLELDWRCGIGASALYPGERAVQLSDGRRLVADGLVLATGASPVLPWGDLPAGVHLLRTLDDAVALRDDLRPGTRLAVVGAGFIGAEVASTAHGLGLDVTLIEGAPAALTVPLGPAMAAVVSGLHAEHGVRVLCGTPVSGFTGDARVTGVRLADGRLVAADTVLIGVGVAPNTGWLAGTALGGRAGVPCDPFGATELPGVVAVGDCASWFEPCYGEHVRLEHWTAARERAAIAAATLLSGGQQRLVGRPPYFWSDQYGITIQLAGHVRTADSVAVEEGAVAARELIAVYRRAGEPVAVLALGLGRSFMRWRKQLATSPVVTG